MRAGLKFQFRVFKLRLNLFFCLLYLVFSIAFLFGNIQNYQLFQDEKSNFLDYEKQKVKNYVNYDQYGAYGFDVILEPSPISIFFNTEQYFLLVSNIDTREVIKLQHSYQQTNGNNYTKFLTYFGIIIMIFAGANIFPGDPKKLTIIVGTGGILRTYIPKLFLYLLFFALVKTINLFFAVIAGVKLSHTEIKYYYLFVLFFLITEALYFSLAVIVSSFFKKKHYKFFVSICLIFSLFLIFSVFLKTPKMNENKKNLKKLTNIMDFEREKRKEVIERAPKTIEEKQKIQKAMSEEFMVTVYLQNLTLEDRQTEEIRHSFMRCENISIWFPGSYIDILSSEISSKGKLGVIKFREYLKKLRYKFLLYYKDKRFSDENLGNVVIKDFVKNGENVFHAPPSLPEKYFLSLIISTIMFILIFIVVFLRIWFLRNEAVPGRSQRIGGLKKGVTYFFKYMNDNQKYEIINGFPGSIYVPRVDSSDIGETSIKPKWLLEYLCQLNKVSFKTIDIKTREIIEKYTWDYFFIGYLLMLIERSPVQVIIVEDYFRGFDVNLNKNLLKHFKTENRNLLYMSKEMFFTQGIAVHAENKIIPIDLTAVFFR